MIVLDGSHIVRFVCNVTDTMRLKLILEYLKPCQVVMTMSAPRARPHGFVGNLYILFTSRLKEGNEKRPACDSVGNFSAHIDNYCAPLSGTVPVLAHPVSHLWL